VTEGVLEDDVGGRLVYDENWVEPLVELMESTKVRNEASLQARERALERYDVRVAIKKYKSILSALQSLN